MSRADMGRTNRPRTVNATNNHRPRFVCPRAKYRSSVEEWVVFKRNAIGTFKKTSSISQSVTRCVGQFFPMLPSSQSHPSHCDGSSLAMPLCISQTYTCGQAACPPAVGSAPERGGAESRPLARQLSELARAEAAGTDRGFPADVADAASGSYAWRAGPSPIGELRLTVV